LPNTSKIDTKSRDDIDQHKGPAQLKNYDCTMRFGPGRWAWLTDTMLLLSSYAAMFIAMALRFDCPHWLRWACIGLAVIGVAATFYFLSLTKSLSHDSATLASVDDRGADVAGYLATYLLPLVVVGAPKLNDILAYALILCVIGLVYVRSRMVQINPTFYVLGYRLFYVATDEGFAGYLLARREPEAGSRLHVIRRARLLIEVGSGAYSDA
jgi:hypothetical protein